MTPKSIRSESGDVGLFQTTDGDWRVMDFSGEYPETIYWGPSLKHAMRYFGFWTARKPYDQTRLSNLATSITP